MKQCFFTEAGFCLQKGREEKSRVGESGSIHGTAGGGVGFSRISPMTVHVPLAHQGDYHRLLLLAQLGKWSYFEGPFLGL